MKKTAYGLVTGALVGALSGCVIVAVSPLPGDGLALLAATVAGRSVLLLAAVGAGGLAGGVLGAWLGRRRKSQPVHTMARRGLRAGTPQTLAS